MDMEYLNALLKAVSSGKTSVENAAEKLKNLSMEDIEYAHIDHHRSLRKGFPEVIFGEGKTADQITGNGDLSKCYDIGYQTLQNLGHLSYLTRAPVVLDFIQMASDNWNTVYDFGRPSFEVVNDKTIIFIYHGILFLIILKRLVRKLLYKFTY